MEHILVLGATGGIGHWVVKLLAQDENMALTVYVRNPGKLDKTLAGQVKVITGDVLDTANLSDAMKGQDIVVAALSGDWLGQAKSIVSAAQGTSLSHIFWVTGLGIHREVPGKTGEILEYYINRFPEYIQAAEVIAEAGFPYTLVRAANLMKGDNMTYYTQQEGDPVHSEAVDRCAVAKYIADRIAGNEKLADNLSIGITN